MKKRKMSALQRKYFGKRRSSSRSSKRASKVTNVARKRFNRRRSSARVVRRGRSRGGSLMSGWVPLSGREMMVDFGVGLTVGKVNSLVAPFTDGLLEPLGDYKDEARTALIGMVAYKFGSGLIKEAGREYFRFAVMSAGAQTSNALFAPATTSTASASGVELY